MRAALAVALLVSAPAVAACGARTGVGWFDHDGGHEEDAGEEDAGPDASGQFPCNYSRTGDFEAVAPHLRATHSPRLAWGASTLAVTFVYLDISNPLHAACTASADTGWRCAQVFGFGPSRPVSGAVAWSGRDFATCWVDTERGDLLRAIRFDEAGAAIDEVPADLLDGTRSCRGLAWDDDRWLALTDAWEIAVVFALSADLSSAGEPAPLDAPAAPRRTNPTLFTDGAEVYAAWGAGESIEMMLVSRDSDRLHSVEGVPREGNLAVALRDGVAALLFDTPSGSTRALTMVLFELATSRTSERVELSTSGAFSGTALAATGEGFVAAWIEDDGLRRRLVAAPARAHAGPTLELRASMEIYEGPSLAFDGGPSPPAMAYDGLDVYLAATVRQDDAELPEVRLQRLACHR